VSDRGGRSNSAPQAAGWSERDINPSYRVSSGWYIVKNVSMLWRKIRYEPGRRVIVEKKPDDKNALNLRSIYVDESIEKYKARGH
jgi:hypothetical protein